MRKRWIALACLAAFALVGAQPARADVKPPVEVTILGAPRAAVAGQEFAGTLRFTVGAPLRLSNLELKGDGWSVVSVDGLLATLAKGGTVDVPFVVKPSRDDEPLVVRYEADGVPMTRELDLSAASVRRLLEPGKLVGRGTIDPLARPAPTEMMRLEPAPAPPQPTEAQRRARGADPGAGKSEAVQARNIRVHGRFLFTRGDGVDIGADGVTVRVYDNDSPFGSELLATGITDAQGWYDITFFWNPCAVFCDAEPDLYLTFEAANGRFSVKSTAFGAGAYSWATGTTSDYTGSDFDYGWLWPAAEADQPAVMIITDMSRQWRWYVNNEGYSLSAIDVYWPDGASGAYYNGAIHIGTDRQWREDSQSHEYGHHFIANYGSSLSPDYCNGICDSPPNCGHCMWCRETDHDAWAEGWPNWIAHVQTSEYGALYGVAAVNTRDSESIQNCSTSLDDVWRTEGFLGAVLQDIWDSSNEDDPLAPGTWRDRLSLGFDEIFTVTDLDGCTTPATFFTAFGARYPGYKENLWETAKNNAYEIDATAPGAVTGLASTSHTIGVSSPDPTVDLHWTRATDDWSGVGGYGVSVTAGGPAMPAASQNIGNVTSYTTSSLSPGTYWFNIRAVDRAGRWSGSYASWGPFIVRTPVPANLTYALFSGWTTPVVPRPTNDATFGSCPPPTSLTGNTSSTYWNMGGTNNGEQSTGAGFQARVFADDEWQWWVSWPAVGAGGLYYAPNQGPISVRGGRHTFSAVHDAADEIAETNEGDNAWGHQWIWSPMDVTGVSVTNRFAPRHRTAGWSNVVDGSTLQYNADGLRFSTSGWWNAITLRPTDTSVDYDLRLHTASTGPTNGFDTYTQWSSRVGELDAVLVNRNVLGYTTWDVGVVNWDGGLSDYNYEHVRSIGIGYGSTYSATMASGSSMNLFEVYMNASQVGAVSFVVQVTDPDPGAVPLKMRWLDSTFTTGALSSLAGTAVTDANGLARIDATVANTGYHGLMVYRELDAGTAPVHYTVRIHRTPPDFVPYTAAGWYSPFVPRAAADGTGASVPAPTTLNGDVASTYFNFGNINQSPTASAPLYQEAYEDGGASSWWMSWGSYPANAVGLFNWTTAWTVRGGRHTLSTIEDPNNDQEEIWENNNAFGEQWIWTPTTLALNASTVRSAPPEVTGGWDHGTTGSIYWNCDALRTPVFSSAGGWWGALAIMPTGSTSDFDPRLHEVSTGAKNGFESPLVQSYFGTGQSDYVMGNFNITAWRAFDVGIVKYGTGTSSYRAEVVGSTYLGTPNGRYGNYTIGPNQILDLYEVYLTAGRWGVDLFGVSGGVDLGLTLHPKDVAYLSKSTSLPGGVSWLAGDDERETVIVDVPATGYYCVAVWKVASDDLPRTATYLLQFEHGSVDAPERPTGATAFRGVSPNPVRTSTAVQFELAREQDATIEVFDLHGARVRTLSSGRLGAGVHRVEWRGDDEAGRGVEPGVYLVRFRCEERVDQRKVIKLR